MFSRRRILPLVRRGELISLWSRFGGVAVQTTGKAMDEGSFGDTIRARTEPNREILHVVITGPKTAEIRAGSGLAMANEG